MNIYSRKNPPEGFYVYAYFNEEGICYYIGKGVGLRAWMFHSPTIPVPKNKKFIKICEHNLSELGAWAIERRLIRWYGRKDLDLGTLLNKSFGGGGSPGYKHTEVAIASMKNRKFSKEWRQKQSLFMLSDANPSRNPFTAKKISKSMAGKSFSDEHKKKLSIAKKGKKQSLSHNKNISQSLLGKPKGPQTKITCPYCSTAGGTSNMKRYHFYNCKLRN